MHNTMMESTVESHNGLLAHDDSMMASTGVDHQSQLALDHHFGGGGSSGGGGGGHHQAHDSEGWNDLSHYHQTAMADYGGFSYAAHGLPSESIQRMPPPPPPLQTLQPLQPLQPHHQHQHQHQHQHHQSHPTLPMLTIPQQQPAWPSMLTNPNGYSSSHSAPPISMPSIVSPSPPGRTVPARPPPSQPRKTLTDEDRRKMCQVHLDNPLLKQTEIGTMFGVERSTVSKVLRKKELYMLRADDRSQSPIKRSKGKLPDIDKAMSIWVRKQQQMGADISDEELLQQARHFAGNTGNSDESLLKVINRTWVDKFKQKNGVGMPRLLRRASETNIPNHIKMSSSPALGHGVLSTTSPTGEASPTSADRSDDEAMAQHGLGFLSYPSEGGGFKRSASQSVTSLNTALTDPTGALSATTMSPASRSFNFSPDPNAGAFSTADQTRQMQAGSASNFQRPRSQTFPTLDMEYLNQQQQQDSTETTPRVHPPAATAPTSALDSPTHELGPAASFGIGIGTAIASPPQHHLRHSSSNGSMAGRSTSDHAASGLSSTPAGSTPTSPTQEDACRAVDTLLHFIQNNGQSGFVDHNDLSTLLRLTDKLRLHQSQMAKVAGISVVGGLSRIPEGDVEMVHTGSVTP